MSFSGSLINGVTAMNAQSSAMGVLSDNIANARTIGYKDVDSRFATLVAAGKSDTHGVGNGVVASSFTRIDQQGILSTSQTTTNFGISGRGFFAVATGADPVSGQVATGSERLVTRAGDFTQNKDGFLVNAAGNYLLGYPAGTTAATGDGAFTALQPIRITGSDALPAQASTLVTLVGNLAASDQQQGDTVNATVTAYDETGTVYSLQVTFNKTAARTWTAELTGGSGPVGSELTATATGNQVTLTFDEAGALVSPKTATSFGSVAFTNSTGATVATLAPNFNFSNAAGIPTFTSAGVVTNISGSITDGHGPLNYVGIQLGDDGVIYKTYDQGKQFAMASVPVVTFVNEYGLDAVSGTAFRVTADSGDPVVNLSETNGAGKVIGNRLEESTVDLADEFSDMIVTQRAYQAASKIVSTSDAMIEIIRDLKN